MDKFFRSFLEIKWDIGTYRVSFLDALLFVAISGSGLIMRLALMGGALSWYGLMDYAAAVLVAVLVWKATGSVTRTLGAYCLFVIMPTVMIQSAYWQKPEMAYAVLTLAALVCIGYGKRAVGSMLYGLAILTNVQAVFVLPVFLILWFYGQLGSRCMGLVAAFTGARLVLGQNLERILFGFGNSAAAPRIREGIASSIEYWEAFGGAPETVEAGKKALEGGTSAVKQGLTLLSDNWPNVYQLLGTEDFLREYAAAGVLFTAALVFSILVLFYLRALRGGKREFSLELAVELCLFFSILIPFFLPHMNARSGLLADLFAVLLAVLNLRRGYVALIHLILSFSMYQNCLTGIVRFPTAAYALVMLGLLIVTGSFVWRDMGRMSAGDDAVCTEGVLLLNRRVSIGKWQIPAVLLVYLAGMLLLGIGIRAAFLPYVSQDYTGYWKVWFEEIHKYGGMKSLSQDFYDYAPMFMYFLVFIEGLPFDPMYSYKIAMCVMDLAAAGAAALLVRELTGSKEKGVFAFGFVFLLPTVMANSALWCQCDVIYATLLLLCLYCFMKEKPVKAMVFLSLSFSLKLQTLFIFPALIIFWVHKKVKAEHFLLLPAVYALSILPAWLFGGRSLKDLLLVYVAQGNTDVWALTLSWPNIYEIMNPKALLTVYSGLGKAMVLVVLMCSMYYMAKKKYPITKDVMLQLFLFYGMLTVYFLPFMHERYGYLVDILAVVYAVRNPKRFYFPLLHVLISYVSYTSFLTDGEALPMIVYAFLLLFLLVSAGWDLFRSMQKQPEALT
ncbi:MAG: hypothetical protein PUI37_00425 [Oscillospiraceae bacterium]|nr:hypothetical protein [Oscillospiraceae bacterium]